MKWLCCRDLQMALGSDTDYDTKLRHHGGGLGYYNGTHVHDISNGAIQEDALLEDMCELAGTEFDGDATQMTNRDKNHMLKRLSKAPKTEQYFKSERAFSEFVNSRLALPDQERQKTHLGIVIPGVDSRVNSNISRSLSRLSGHGSFIGQDGSSKNVIEKSNTNIHDLISRADSHIVNHRSPSHTNNILIKIGSAANASFAANPNYRQSQVNMNPQVKRMSKTHEMAVDIIKKRDFLPTDKSFDETRQTAMENARSSIQSLFDTRNSRIVDQHRSMFSSRNNSINDKRQSRTRLRQR